MDEEKNPNDGPSYYARIPVQPIEYMHMMMSKEEFRGYCVGNIIKYLSRYGYKDDPKKEARKVFDYARWLFENEVGRQLSVSKEEKIVRKPTGHDKEGAHD